MVVAKINQQILQSSLLDVFKDGVEITGTTLKLIYNKPATSYNPTLEALYKKNRFTVMQEVIISDHERVDLVLFVNGLAVVSCDRGHLFQFQILFFCHGTPRFFSLSRASEQRAFSGVFRAVSKIPQCVEKSSIPNRFIIPLFDQKIKLFSYFFFPIYIDGYKNHDRKFTCPGLNFPSRSAILASG